MIKISRRFSPSGVILSSNGDFYTGYVISEDEKEAFQLGLLSTRRGCPPPKEGMLDDFQRDSHLGLCNLFSSLRFIHCAAAPKGSLNNWYENHPNKSSTYPFLSFPEKYGLLTDSNGVVLKVMSISLSIGNN